MKTQLLSMFAVAALTAAAPAAILTWDGGGANDFWMTAVNWNPNVTPASGDHLEFDGNLPLIGTNNFAAGFQFGSVTFSSSGYVVHGNALALTNGITLLGAIGPIAFYPNVTLNADQRFTVSRLNARLDLLGTLNLNGFTPEFFMAGTCSVHGAVSGAGGLTLSSGTLIFNADNTGSGTAQLDGGLFLVHGTNPNINANVNSGATFGGTGSVRRIISAGGTIRPGDDGPGILTASATTTFDANTTFAVQLNGTSAGTSYDRLVTGSGALGNAMLDVSIGYPMLAGDQFTIIEVGGGSLTGAFFGLAEGALFVADNMQFQITYAGGSGNDVVLTAVAQQPSGTTRTWDGGGTNHLWTTPANWVGDVAPQGGDTLAFPIGAAQLANVNDYPDGFAFNIIQISGAGYNITGNRLALLSISGIHASYPNGTSTLGTDLTLLDNLTVVNFVAALPTLVLSGDIDLGNHNASFVCEGPIVLSGVISGTGGISKGKNPALRLAGAAPNTYTGPTTILGLGELNKPAGVAAIVGPLLIGNDAGAASEVRLLANEQISNTSTVTVFNAGTFNLDGFDETIHTLCLTGGVVTTMSGTLTVLSSVQTKASASVASISGNLALGGTGDRNFIIPNGAAAPDLNISAVISGGANVHLRKIGTGQLRLSGTSPNTLAGAIKAHAGTIELQKTGGGVVAVAGSLEVGDGLGGANADLVRHLASHEIADTAPVFIASSGRIDLNGFNDTVGPVTLEGGNIITGNGILTLNSSVVGNSGGGVSTISGRLALGSGTTRIFDIELNATLQIDAVISGGAGMTLVKTNQGQLLLTMSNLFSGPISAAQGTLAVSTNGALGNTNGATMLNGGRLLLLDTLTADELLVVNTGLLEVEGICPWTGPAQLNADLNITNSAGEEVTFVGVWSGVGGLHKTGGGILRFHGPDPNIHTGTNRHYGGELQLYRFSGTSDVVAIPGPLIVGDGLGGPGADFVLYGGHGEIADIAPVTINSSGEISLNGWADVIGSLSGSGSVDLATGELAVGGDNGNAEFSGIIFGMGPLAKVGAGIQTFSGNNTYTGNTTISNGTLLVNGQQPASSVFVRSGATLGGAGTVARIVVASGGTLSPGSSPGVITPSGFVTFADSNSVFRVELNGLTPGVGHDQLNAPFAVSLANATLDVTLGFTPAASNSFTIVNKAGGSPVTGTFNGLPEGAIFTTDGGTFQITYAGADGNDVVLTFLAMTTPEFASIIVTATNTLVFQAQGAANTSYVLEATPHLDSPIPWSPISTNTTDGAGLLQFIDAGWTNFPTRFYRLSKF